MEFLHRANAEELANIAKETGAEVLRVAGHTVTRLEPSSTRNQT